MMRGGAAAAYATPYSVAISFPDHERQQRRSGARMQRLGGLSACLQPRLPPPSPPPLSATHTSARRQPHPLRR